jgi:hypothetical protein
MKLLNKKAVSILEYVVLFIIIISAFLIMKNYIQRGIYGKWAQAGQSYAFGRQYDAQKTIDCGFDPQSNTWYDYNCFTYFATTLGCNGDPVCDESIITGPSCTASSCSQLNNGSL